MPDSSDPRPPDPRPLITNERAEDFENVYANNVRFETSVWDLKMVLGQLDQTKNDPASVVEFHTAATMPWTTAKIAAYFMAVNLFLYQREHGEIKIPAVVVPPRPSPSNQSFNLFDHDALVYLEWLHDQFFGSNPYVPPGINSEEP